ncbi:hypothetical protein M9H77_18467 [Catharanthus roseus]|uniref:Uncharacterized protein n=1 Tax=Catharanthus roseus TaxID=4058 RepID=A0ACC0B7I3_CATRO|nr:hypothetical protein M9H77_18467 [Catharanthus roseus]
MADLTPLMGRLVAKQSNALLLLINKGLPKVERSFRRHSSSRQYFLVVFLAFFLPKIEESSSGSIIHQSSSKSVQFEKKLPSPQVNTLPKRRIEGLSYILGISGRFCDHYYIINQITLFAIYLLLDFQT